MEQAKKVGKDDAWREFLDKDTLKDLEKTELESLAKSGLHGAGTMDQQSQLDALSTRMDQLSRQFQSLMDLQTGTIQNPTVSLLNETGAGAQVSSPVIPPQTNMAPTGGLSVPTPPLSTSAGAGVGGSQLTQGPAVGAAGGQQSGASGKHMGLPSQHQANTVPASQSPVSWLSDPLTSALNQLSSVMDPDALSCNAGMIFRPEYHAQHRLQNIPTKNLDHKKMSYKHLMFGMVSVARYLYSTNSSIDDYLAHMEFITRHACEGSYVDNAYSDYDRHVDRYLRNSSAGFVMADPVAVGHSFHPAKLVGEGGEGRNPGRNRRKSSKRGQGNQVPDGYPEQNCYFWNYKVCSATNCSKNRICDGAHKALGCPKDIS